MTQSDLADSVANDVKVYLRVEDPEGGAVDWFQIDEPKTVGLNGETTFYEYDWTPTKSEAMELVPMLIETMIF